jgi:hypothetical protein
MFNGTGYRPRHHPERAIRAQMNASRHGSERAATAPLLAPAVQRLARGQTQAGAWDMEDPVALAIASDTAAQPATTTPLCPWCPLWLALHGPRAKTAARPVPAAHQRLFKAQTIARGERT